MSEEIVFQARRMELLEHEKKVLYLEREVFRYQQMAFELEKDKRRFYEQMMEAKKRAEKAEVALARRRRRK